ncbi:MAG: hypothetical protein NVSMB14_18380 [Isosphaeraceae bacterium]
MRLNLGPNGTKGKDGTDPLRHSKTKKGLGWMSRSKDVFSLLLYFSSRPSPLDPGQSFDTLSPPSLGTEWTTKEFV